LTSNDDLESISARGRGADDSDSEDDSEEAAAAAADDSDDDSSAMRTFTAARLDSTTTGGGSGGSARSTKLKTENLNPSTVKIENSECGKDGGALGAGTVGPGAAAPGNSMAGIVVKEDATKIFTENIQTSGAYSAREESLKREVKGSEALSLNFFV
jgi:histone acetyltransferase